MRVAARAAALPPGRTPDDRFVAPLLLVEEQSPGGPATVELAIFGRLRTTIDVDADPPSSPIAMSLYCSATRC